MAEVGGLRTVPPLAVKPGPRGLSRVSPCAALRSATRSDELQTAKFASGGNACPGLDTEPPATRQGAGAGRHGLPQQTATTNGRRRQGGPADEDTTPSQPHDSRNRTGPRHGPDDPGRIPHDRYTVAFHLNAFQMWVLDTTRRDQPRGPYPSSRQAWAVANDLNNPPAAQGITPPPATGADS